MTDIKHIKDLITRFLRAQATTEEEQELYRFFQQTQEIPASLRPYADFFRDMAALGEEDEELPRTALSTPAMPTLPIQSAQKVQPRNRPLSLLRVWARIGVGTAACVALLAGVMWGYSRHEQQMLARTYGGSYMIVNGVRIDDLSLISDSIRLTLSKAEAIESRMASHDPVADAEKRILENVPPSQRNRIKKILDN